MKKRFPCSAYEMERIESWLNGQAKQGHVLKAWGVFRAEFFDEEMTGWRFALDVDGNGAPDRERMNELLRAGWEYVDSISGPGLRIYKTRDPKAVLWPREDLWKRSARRETWKAAGSWGLVVFLVAAGFFLNDYRFWFLNMMQGTLYDLLVQIAFWGMLCLGIAGPTIVQQIRFVNILRRGREEWMKGQRERERGDARAGFFAVWQTVASLLWLAVIVFGLNGAQIERIPFSEAVKSLPAVNLNAVEDDAAFQIGRTTFRDDPGVNYADQATIMIPVLAKKHYTTWQDGSYGLYGPSAALGGEYWQVGEKTGDRLFDALIKRYTEYDIRKKRLPEGSYVLEEREKEGYSRLVTARAANGADFAGSGKKLVFARRGNLLFYLEYDGDKEVEELLDALF